MKSKMHYILQPIVRFGALTPAQLEKIYEGKISRASIYRSLKELVKNQLIGKVSHPTKLVFAYEARSDAYSIVYNSDEIVFQKLKLLDLNHVLACADAMIGISQYAFVKGISTEHEILRNEFKDFCYKRIPDGIIQINRKSLVYELALEVETSSKSDLRIMEILSCYKKTFQDEMLCSGVIFVVPQKNLAQRYKKLVSNLPVEIQEKIVISEDLNLSDLKEIYFGRRENKVGIALDYFRTFSQNRSEYFPMNPEVSIKNIISTTPIYRGSVSNGGVRNSYE